MAPDTLQAASNPGLALTDSDGKSRPVRLRYTDVLGPDDGLDFGVLGLGGSIDLSLTRLASASARAGQEVLIQNVPTTQGRVRVALLDGSSIVGWGMFRKVDQNSIALVVPLLPNPSGGDGGDLDLAVFVRGAQGPALHLHVEALPPADQAKGSFAILDKLREVVHSDPNIAASSPVRALFDELLDGPDNPDAMAKILRGQAAILDGRPFDPELLDRLLGDNDVLALLEDYRARYSASTGGSSGYRVQDLSGLIGQLRDNATYLSDLEDRETRVGNAIAKAVASYSSIPAFLRPSREASIAGIVYSNFIAFATFFLEIYDAAKLPSKVTLDRIDLHGAALGDGQSVYSGCSTTPPGSWNAYGRITTFPLKISAGDLASDLTVSTGTAVAVALAAKRIFASKAVKEKFKEAEAAANDLAWNEDTHQLAIAQESEFFNGDLTAYLQADFAPSEKFLSSQGNSYQLSGAGGYARITVRLRPEFPAPNFEGTSRVIYVAPVDGNATISWWTGNKVKVFDSDGRILHATVGNDWLFNAGEDSAGQVAHLGKGTYYLYEYRERVPRAWSDWKWHWYGWDFCYPTNTAGQDLDFVSSVTRYDVGCDPRGGVGVISETHPVPVNPDDTAIVPTGWPGSSAFVSGQSGAGQLADFIDLVSLTTDWFRPGAPEWSNVISPAGKTTIDQEHFLLVGTSPSQAQIVWTDGYSRAVTSIDSWAAGKTISMDLSPTFGGCDPNRVETSPGLNFFRCRNNRAEHMTLKLKGTSPPAGAIEGLVHYTGGPHREYGWLPASNIVGFVKTGEWTIPNWSE